MSLLYKLSKSWLAASLLINHLAAFQQVLVTKILQCLNSAVTPGCYAQLDERESENYMQIAQPENGDAVMMDELKTCLAREYCCGCGQAKIDEMCENCSERACAGWYGSCCSCGHEFVVAMVD
jgi:hypothetical protein